MRNNANISFAAEEINGLYFVWIAVPFATSGLFSPVPVVVRMFPASAYGGLMKTTSFFRSSGFSTMSRSPWGSLSKESLRKSNWKTWLASMFAPFLMRSFMTSTSAWSSVEAQILYLFCSPARRLPVPAAQSQTSYSSCHFSPRTSASVSCAFSTHICGVKNEPLRSRTSCGTRRSRRSTM